MAEERLLKEHLNHEYLPLEGLKEFTYAATAALLGKDNPVVKEGRFVTIQALSGTGALRVAGQFLFKFYPYSKTIYLPSPTWPNHHNIFPDAGLKIEFYRYYDQNTISLDISGLLEDLAVLLFSYFVSNNQQPLIKFALALSLPARTLPIAQFFFSMFLLIIQQESTQPKSNGRKSPKWSLFEFLPPLLFILFDLTLIVTAKRSPCPLWLCLPRVCNRRSWRWRLLCSSLRWYGHRSHHYAITVEKYRALWSLSSSHSSRNLSHSESSILLLLPKNNRGKSWNPDVH